MKRDSKQILTELLVLKAQAGDENAFRDLHEIWSKDLERMAFLQIKDALVVQEITQDAWVSIARGLRKLDDPACFPRWAFRILDRRCSDWLRKQVRERKKGEFLAESDLYQQSEHASKPTAIAANLSEAIASLDSKSVKLLHLFYIHDLGIDEISGILDVPNGTVKSRLFTLREKLRQMMERTGE